MGLPPAPGVAAAVPRRAAVCAGARPQQQRHHPAARPAKRVPGLGDAGADIPGERPGRSVGLPICGGWAAVCCRSFLAAAKGVAKAKKLTPHGRMRDAQPGRGADVFFQQRSGGARAARQLGAGGGRRLPTVQTLFALAVCNQVPAARAALLSTPVNACAPPQT